MKGLVLVSLIAAFGAAAVATGICECLVATGWEREIRTPFYAGIGAGVFLALVGLPFALKLAAIGNASDSKGGFWKWWGAGLLLRLALMMVLALSLMAFFKEYPAAALLPMAGVYLMGMFAEAAWVAKILFGKDTLSKTT